jgi:hypothetical protein
VAVLLQVPLVPVTVYVVVAAGATVMLLPVKLPGCQVYEVAPLAVRKAGLPAQTAAGPLTVTVGDDVTVTATVPVAVHPDTVTPVTV